MLKLGRFGPFVSCTSFPDCRHSRPLSGDPAEREEARRPVVLGTDAETGLALTLRRGRYGRQPSTVHQIGVGPRLAHHGPQGAVDLYAALAEVAR